MRVGRANSAARGHRRARAVTPLSSASGAPKRSPAPPLVLSRSEGAHNAQPHPDGFVSKRGLNVKDSSLLEVGTKSHGFVSYSLLAASDRAGCGRRYALEPISSPAGHGGVHLTDGLRSYGLSSLWQKALRHLLARRPPPWHESFLSRHLRRDRRLRVVP